jgi:hypothetical protein
MTTQHHFSFAHSGEREARGYVHNNFKKLKDALAQTKALMVVERGHKFISDLNDFREEISVIGVRAAQSAEASKKKKDQ